MFSCSAHFEILVSLLSEGTAHLQLEYTETLNMMDSQIVKESIEVST